MNALLVRLTLALKLLLASTLVHAAVSHVNTAQRLQSALTLAATNGEDDTIYLAAGTYRGNFNFNSTEDHDLLIEAEPGTTNTAVVLDGNGTGRALNVAGTGMGRTLFKGISFLRNNGQSETASLRVVGGASRHIVVEECRFFMSNAALARGSGLEVEGGFSATILRTLIQGNGTRESGDGARLSADQLYVWNCEFAMNSGGRALFVGRGGTLSVLTNVFRDNYDWSVVASVTSEIVLHGNLISGPARIGDLRSDGAIHVIKNEFRGNGGGLGLHGGDKDHRSLVSSNTFDSNAASYALMVGSGAPLIENNTFFGNTDGAISVDGYAQIVGNRFVANTGNYGGGLLARLDGTGLVVSSNSFSGNVSRNGGGAMMIDAFGGVEKPIVVIEGNEFAENSSRWAGGACFIANGGTYGTNRIAGNVFMRNQSGAGGGAIAVQGYFDTAIVNNLVVSNRTVSDAGRGGGILVLPRKQSAGHTWVLSNTIADNHSVGHGGGLGVFLEGTAETVEVHNNIIWGNSAELGGGDVWIGGTGFLKSFRHNNTFDMEGIWDVADPLVETAPRFIGPKGVDYRLASDSPCIDAGWNGAPLLPSLDLDGNPRIAGKAVDLGCYEREVGAPPRILQEPMDLVAAVGSNACFSVSAASETPIRFQWRRGLANLPGETSSGLCLRRVTPADSGADFNVVLSNDAGSVTSRWARLTVLLPPEIISSPTNQVIMVGGTASFSATASGSAPLAYQWYFDHSALAGETGSILKVVAARAEDVGRYWVRVTNSAGEATSRSASLWLCRVRMYAALETFGPPDELFDVLAGTLQPPGNLQPWMTNVVADSVPVRLFDLDSPDVESRFYQVRPIPKP